MMVSTNLYANIMRNFIKENIHNIPTNIVKHLQIMLITNRLIVSV